MHYLSGLTGWLNRYKLSLGVSLLASALLYFVLEPPAIADLSEEHRHYTGELLQSWDRGEVVVLLRHLERCDRYDVPCLTDKSGLTARAKLVGDELHEDFGELGLDKAIVYNSPALRTAETEALVFGDVGEERDWLASCEEDFIDNALSNKQADRNLILVTHSHCINHAQEALGYAEELPSYGSAIFLSLEDNPEVVKVLGFIDPEDWDLTFGH
ncbi:histidine phosphatase family protein [Pseudomonas sp. MYb185]|uniref:lipopolysaccharide core heptose(II)-phosphate phosphatase PmrG n=1 Tax=Pseudomonas sp. MYb185 TaxID=1848729 RepID=UPI000CFAAC64|nr:histidine phosphatase family protein [Pseudomonas sp. MYb185]PRB84046.1 histidine phosphatase family protein [Pseudomonas sp. MYb185]